MLTGVDQEGKRIVAARFESAHEIRLKYAFGSLQCPFCKQSIFPRERQGFVLHFVHQHSCTSTIPHHPESPEHEEAKLKVAKFLKQQIKDESEEIVDVEVEYHLPRCGEHGRIADVALVYSNGNLLIAECQLSRITTNELEQRTRDYHAIGADVLWFLGKMQIHLRTKTGCVRCSVQLAGLSSTTSQIKGLDSCLISSKTLAACSVQQEEATLTQKVIALQETVVEMEQRENCSVEQEYSASKLVQFTLANVVISFQDFPLLPPGIRVTRMGRYGWSGEVLEVDIKSVLVRWDGDSKQEWLDRSEVYLLNFEDESYISGKIDNLLKIAQRARIVLDEKTFSNENMEKYNQLRLF